MREIGGLTQVIYLRLSCHHKALSKGLVVGAMAGEENEQLVQRLIFFFCVLAQLFQYYLLCCVLYDFNFVAIGLL